MAMFFRTRVPMLSHRFWYQPISGTSFVVQLHLSYDLICRATSFVVQTYFSCELICRDFSGAGSPRPPSPPWLPTPTPRARGFFLACHTCSWREKTTHIACLQR